MATYHITVKHDRSNCFGPPNEDKSIMSLWRQVKTNAKQNNVEIMYFKINPSQHIFFILLEAPDYSDVEKTIGQCKKTADFTITPVVEQIFYS